MRPPDGGSSSAGPFARYPATPASNEAAGETLVQTAPPFSSVRAGVRQHALQSEDSVLGMLAGLFRRSSQPVERAADGLKLSSVVGGGSVKRWSQHISDFDTGVDQLNAEYASARADSFGVAPVDDDSTGAIRHPEQVQQAHDDRVADAAAALMADLRRRYHLLEDNLDGDAADVAGLLDREPSEETVLELFQAGALPMATPALFPNLDFSDTDIERMLLQLEKYGDLPPGLDPEQVAGALAAIDHLLGVDDFGINGNRDDLRRMLDAIRGLGDGGAEFVLLGLSDDELSQLEDMTTDTDGGLFSDNGLEHWDLIDFHALFLAGASTTQLLRLKEQWASIEPDLASAGEDDNLGLSWGDPPDLDLFNFDADGNATASNADVDQGGLGDCWMIAKMAALEQADGSSWAIDHVSLNPNGTISVTMYDSDGNPHTVVVTDQLPVDDDGDVALAGNDSTVLWPAYYEKAFALASEHGSDGESGYGGIEGGWGTDDAMLMTGNNADEIDVDSDDVRDAVDSGRPVAVCTTGDDHVPDELKDEWYENHCYYVVGVDSDGNVELANPWGTEEGTFTITQEQFEDHFDQAAVLNP